MSDAKRLEFLTTWRESCNGILNGGVNTLKYCKIDTTRYEQELNRIKAVFNQDKPQKNELVEACATFDTIAFEMSSDFANWLGDDKRQYDTSIVLDMNHLAM